MTEVRLAGEADIPQIMEWGMKFVAFHPLLAQFEPEVSALEGMVRNLIESDRAEIFIHDTGMLGAMLVPLWTNPSKITATEFFWWAEGGGKRLLEAFEQWAEESGAAQVQMLCIEGVHDVAPIYESRGYVPIERAFMRRV